MNIKILVPALITNKKQEKMTNNLVDSLKSNENEIDIIIDKQKYETMVAGVWNKFFDNYRGTDYDYLMITANDMIADRNCIDYMVRFSVHNDIPIVSGKVIRDDKEFRKWEGKIPYTDEPTNSLKDPASFILKKGVVEKVGRIDEEFPCEFVERDYLYRCKLAGFAWEQPDNVLFYHPPYAGTIGNDGQRLQKALRKYVAKWGGDANQERYIFPYNDCNLNFTYCKK